MKYLFITLLLLTYYARSQDTPASQADGYLKNCEAFLPLGKPDSVRKYAVAARNLALQHTLSHQLAKADFFIGNSIVRFAPDSAYQLMKRSYDEFFKLNDTKYLASTSNSLGSYFAQKGAKPEAIAHYLRGKDYAEKYYSTHETAKYPRTMAIFNHNLSNMYIEMSEYKKALDYALKALSIAQSANLPEVIGPALNNLGMINFGLKQDQEAERYFSEALQLMTTPASDQRKGVVLNNLGNIQLRQRNFPKAKKYYEAALEIAKAQKDFPAASQRLNNLSNVEMATENYTQSKKYLLEALEYAETSQMKAAKLKALANLALNQVMTDNVPEAIRRANEALALAKEINSVEVLPQLYNTLEKAYKKQKDFGKAMEFQQAKMKAKDSLYQVSTTLQLQELQTKYETNKKEKQIELLESENRAKAAELKQKNYFIAAICAIGLLVVASVLLLYRQRVLKQKQLTAEMKQRLLRAQLNPHFLFNSLNSIQRLYVDGRTLEANDFIADFAQLMRDILEKTGRTTIPLYEEMEFIEAYLSLEKRRLGDRFEYEIKMNDEIRNSDVEVPSFIVQPLAENALLHGVLPNSKKGKIEISVSRPTNERLAISVIDDGVGFYQSLQRAGKHTSKGMELIKSRLGRQGSMLVEELKNRNQEVMGTKVTLQFDL